MQTLLAALPATPPASDFWAWALALCFAALYLGVFLRAVTRGR